MKNYIGSPVVACEREEKVTANNYYTEKDDGNSSYSVKSDVQNKIVSSKGKDICHIADAPRCERVS